MDAAARAISNVRRAVVCLLATALTASSCAFGSQPNFKGASDPAVQMRGDTISIGGVDIRGQSPSDLTGRPNSSVLTNGTDTFYLKRLTNGGYLVLYRYSPPRPTITSDPYPRLTVHGRTAVYSAATSVLPYFSEQTLQAPRTFEAPYRQMKWPALLFNQGTGIVFLAESPMFEEAIEPFVSAYPMIRTTIAAEGATDIQFGDEAPNAGQQINLAWKAIEHTKATTTYIASLGDPSISAVALRLTNASTAERVWYLNRTWQKATTEFGSRGDSNLMLVHTNQPTELLIESSTGPPSPHAVAYYGTVGYVQRARWAAFAVYQNQTSQSFFDRSIVPALSAYDGQMYALRDTAAPTKFAESWRALLQLDAFSDGENILNHKFFRNGFPEAADPSYASDPSLDMSVSWVSDEAGLQAAMGARLFGFGIDPRYSEAVRTFYDPALNFYWGAYLRSQAKFVSADTGGNGVIIGYNYLLSLSRLTELIGTPVGLPATEVQGLVDRVLPILQPGYIAGYYQVPYLWRYPQLDGLQWEYGMGKELSEAQLSYICGLWWLRTHEPRYRDCQLQAIDFAETFPLRLRGSSFLWGLDVVHGSYVLDALLLAYRTTHDRQYLDSALQGWRYELLFLFSTQDYPETPFDDRSVAVKSYYSTFASLSRGNYWRDDSWNNARPLWSLAKLLAFTDDPSIIWRLSIADQTHRESYPIVDSVYTPVQRSDYYRLPIDPNDQALGWEDLANHYSTQIAFSTDVWREAYLFSSLHASSGAVYRIPGVLLSDPGVALVVGEPNQDLEVTIDAADVNFANGQKSMSVHLDARGIARIALVTA